METIWFLNKTENLFLFPVQVLPIIYIKYSHNISACIFNSQSSLLKFKKKKSKKPNLFYIQNWSILSYVNLSS